MEFIIMILIYFGAILVHEITHFIIGWYFSKNIPEVRFKSLGVQVKTNLYNKKQKQIFLGYAIIAGLLSLVPFYFYYPTETWIVLIAYIFSCWNDFKNLMLLEVQK